MSVEGNLRVGFVGLGRMGSRMAANIARAGFPLVLYNRTRDTAELLADELGATVAGSAADAASQSDVMVTMLSDPEATLAVYQGPSGILEGLKADAVAVDMGTTGEEASRAIATFVESIGAGFVDAPVSGSVAFAESGSLTIMAGGADAHVKRVMPILEAMGSKIFHLGPTGAGSIMKLAVNAVVYGLCEALSEALVLAEASGIDRERAYEVFASSAAAAPFVHYRREEFEHPGTPPVAFRLALAKKDLDLILTLAGLYGTPMPQADVNRATLERAMDAGWSEHDVSAVAEYLRQETDGAGRR
jgi:3-hydroxyisobutyrate dehydrogenase-like beta-hydroxyacid dehydrogenase